MKTTAAAAAAELRMLADALDVNPMLEIVQPSIYFNHGAEKGTFVDLAKILPRPLRKRVGRDDDPYSDFELIYGSPSMTIMSYVRRSVFCEIVEPARPAVYRCPPILSEEDEAQVTAHIA